MENEQTTLSRLASLYNQDEFRAIHEEMSFADYLEIVRKNPKRARNAFQYIHDMITSKGTSTFERYRRTYTKYHFFSESETPIFGLEETLENLANFIHGAAYGYGTERRILMLHGPVGSSKSTICRVLKKGLEEYSRTEEGAWYTYKWVNLPFEGPDAIFTTDTDVSPMNEDPLKLLPIPMRQAFYKELNAILAEQTPEDQRTEIYELGNDGELNPRCKNFLNLLLDKYNGDILRVLNNHIRVIRRVHSEIDRVGIGTFQPKDEKNQDSTELNGDMNFHRIGHFGSDSDPRAFNFDGEFCVANRGMCEFIEMLKLAKEFLYDLLGASQEHQIKPKKFSQIRVDELIVAHTNNPEFEKFKADQFMEALRDRTVRIDVPYLLRWSDELKVYEQDYGPGRVKQHIMPHTLEIASFFAILTRVEDDPEGKLDLRDKVKLYDGRNLPNWTEDTVKELRDKYPSEGMGFGVSARYCQEKISNVLAKYSKYVNVFHVLSELKQGLGYSSLISKIEDVKRYEFCIELAIKELDEILKTEVQKALVADENAVIRLCAKYIDNVAAYVNKEKIIDPITKARRAPDERLMRSIEEKAGIREQGSDDFRLHITQFMGTLLARKLEFRWDSNEELRRALEAKIFEDVKDTIKLSSLSSEAAAVDPELQEKIDAIKTRLVNQYGYNWQSATDVLDYVSGIFARGDVSNN